MESHQLSIRNLLFVRLEGVGEQGDGKEDDGEEEDESEDDGGGDVASSRLSSGIEVIICKDVTKQRS